jgi:RNA polymerase sigma-70 factor (ECF subfamily)
VEITNDAFFKVFKEVTKFLPRHENASASFKAWFKKILVNTSIDHFRKYHKKEIMATSEMGTTLLIDQQETAEDLLQYKEIIKLIQQLSPAYRAVFNLYIFEGFTHAEIAKTLKISEGSSKSNLFKARQHLQAFFKHNKSLNLKKEMTIC